MTTVMTEADLRQQVKDANRELARRQHEEQEQRLAAARWANDPTTFIREHTRPDEHGVPRPALEADPKTLVFHDGAMFVGQWRGELHAGVCHRPPDAGLELTDRLLKYWRNAVGMAEAEFERLRAGWLEFANSAGAAARPAWNAKAWGPFTEADAYDPAEPLGRMAGIVRSRRAKVADLERRRKELPEVVAAMQQAEAEARRRQSQDEKQAAFYSRIAAGAAAVTI